MSFLLMLSAGVYLAFILFIIAGLFRHNEQSIISTDQTPVVSVVIAARNEENNLPDLIPDLVNQEYPLDQLEVIIVDDRSTDSTAKISREAAENYAIVKYIRVETLSTEMTPKKYALTWVINKSRMIVSMPCRNHCIRINRIVKDEKRITPPIITFQNLRLLVILSFSILTLDEIVAEKNNIKPKIILVRAPSIKPKKIAKHKGEIENNFTLIVACLREKIKPPSNVAG